MMDSLNILSAFRQELHANPELSGAEVATSQRVKKFLRKHSNPEIIENLGGNGLAAIYNYGEAGPTVLIRCELDALPILETNQMDYRSTNDNVSHKCGHDGHMTMVAGLVFWLRDQRYKKGRVVLLFQPAEETGKGAALVLKDPRFKLIEPDYAFALHNIPGVPMHDVILLDNGFSATVQSFSIVLTGKESHAAEPSKGINPAMAVSALIQELQLLIKDNPESDEFCVLTPVYINLGDKNYGMSPAKGELHYTVRTWSEDHMGVIEEVINNKVKPISDQQHLVHSIDWFEYFPGAVVDGDCNQIVKRSAASHQLNVREQSHPFRFGEDFGWIARKYKSTMFGLGSGMDTPPLHHASYDFPDELISTGVTMFQGIIEELLN